MRGIVDDVEVRFTMQFYLSYSVAVSGGDDQLAGRTENDPSSVRKAHRVSFADGRRIRVRGSGDGRGRQRRRACAILAEKHGAGRKNDHRCRGEERDHSPRRRGRSYKTLRDWIARSGGLYRCDYFIATRRHTAERRFDVHAGRLTQRKTRHRVVERGEQLGVRGALGKPPSDPFRLVG